MKSTVKVAGSDEVVKSCKKLCEIYHKVLEELADSLGINAIRFWEKVMD